MKLETYEIATKLLEKIKMLEKVRNSNSMSIVGLSETGGYTSEAPRDININDILKQVIDVKINQLEQEFECLGNEDNEAIDEFELERRKIEDELLELGGTRDFWSIGHDGIPRYHFSYEERYDKMDIYESYSFFCQGVIYFSTKELAKKAIETIGENRIKKYLFYAEDSE